MCAAPLSTSKKSAQQIYVELKGVPSSQWSGIISRLDSSVKRSLLLLLKEKRPQSTSFPPSPDPAADGQNGRSETSSAAPVEHLKSDVANRHKRRSIPTSSGGSSSTSGFPTDSPESPTFSAETSQADGRPTKRQRRCINPGGGKSSSLPSPSSCDSTPIVTDQCRRFSVMPVQSLDCLNRVLYVAGDAPNVLRDSQRIVHRYLNFWVAGLLWDFTRNSLTEWEKVVKKESNRGHESQSPSTNRHMPSSALSWEVIDECWQSRRRLAARFSEYLRAKFPMELEKFERESNFQRFARKGIDGVAVSSGVGVDGAGLSVTTGLQSAPEKSGGNQVDESLERRIREDLIPHERFLQRLRFRDLRTKVLSSSDYREFARSREKTFRTNKVIFQEWINMHAVAISSRKVWLHEAPPTPKRLVPPAVVDCLIFLCTDRVASIVELAVRLRHLIKSPISQPNAVDKGNSGNGPDAQVPSYPSWAAMLADGRGRRAWWKASFRLPTLQAAGTAQYASKVSTPNSSSSGAGLSASGGMSTLSPSLSPKHYLAAVQLIADHLDSPQLSIENPCEMFRSIKDLIPHAPAPSLILESIASKSDSPGPVADGEAISSKASPEMVSTVGQIEGSVKIEPVEEGLKSVVSESRASTTSSASSPSPSVVGGDHGAKEEGQLLGLLVNAATKSMPFQPPPSEVASFASLCCRRLFWEKRHDPAATLWPAILKKFDTMKRNAAELSEFKEKYAKIVRYAQVVQQVVALGGFLERIANTSIAASTAEDCSDEETSSDDGKMSAEFTSNQKVHPLEAKQDPLLFNTQGAKVKVKSEEPGAGDTQNSSGPL